MTNSLKTLFKVKFPHAYYDAGIVQNVSIQPSCSTVRSMLEQGMEFDLQQGEFRVLAKACSRSGGLLPYSQNESLSFYLHSDCETFFKVTEISGGKGMVLYANNVCLGEEQFMSGGWAVLPCNGSRWTFDLVRAVRDAGYGGVLKTLEAWGGVLMSYRLKRPTGETVLEGRKRIASSVDLSMHGLPEGGYVLEVCVGDDLVLPLYRFVYADETADQPPLGVYEWFSPITEGSEDRIEEAGSDHYEVAFRKLTDSDSNESAELQPL